MAAHLSRRLDHGGDLLALHRADPERYPALLESTEVGPHGHWDILFACTGIALRRAADGSLLGAIAPEAGDGDFLSQLDRHWRRESLAAGTDSGGLPFRGGWLLYLGYELAAQVESRLRLPEPESNGPSALALRCPAAILRDRRRDELWLVAEDGQADLLERLASDLAAAPTLPASSKTPVAGISEDPDHDYLDAVNRVLAYIRAGDVFQVNLSRGWRARYQEAVDPVALYQRLRATNPAPFTGLLRQGDWALASSSPERLVSVRNGRVETRPIAGTRPRGADLVQDEMLKSELIGHPKERAEHIMLVDLERNDLGRVAVPGSVRVDELMCLESYATVHHIVSNISARLCPGVTPGEVIRAVFPGGTITGCPKVRCMEIIAELEGTGRGPYTGALGYLNRDGDLDLNILIRTLEVEGTLVRLRAGAGIVADSDPRCELAETRAKAAALLRAVDAC